MKKTIAYLIVLLFFLITLSSCREIVNFIGASLDLGFVIMKWVVILVVGGFILAIIVGVIREIFGLNDKDKK